MPPSDHSASAAGFPSHSGVSGVERLPGVTAVERLHEAHDRIVAQLSRVIVGQH